MTEGTLNVIYNVYHIYAKGRGAYKNFHASNAALIRWRRLFESWTRQSIILTTVLLFSVLICYRIFDFDCIRAAAHIWVNTVFKFNPLNNMYQYNCIFFWASREEKQLFWTLVRLDFLKVLRFSFSLSRRKQQKKIPASALCSRKIWSSLDAWASLPWDECNWSTGLWVILCWVKFSALMVAIRQTIPGGSW